MAWPVSLSSGMFTEAEASLSNPAVAVYRALQEDAAVTNPTPGSAR